jgi:hypothetical protein
MNSLEEINREEWADKPFLIELRGGQSDGKRFRWHDLPHVWRQPEDHGKSLLEMARDCDDPRFDPTRPDWTYAPVADYRMTEHVTDDGACIYEFYCHE